MALPPEKPWGLPKLARLNLPGNCYCGFASAPGIAIEKGDILRLGALVLERSGEESPFAGTDILLASGQIAVSSHAPIVFFRAKDGRARTQSRDQGDHVSLFLGDARESYARIEFDPYERSLAFKVKRTGNGHPIADGSIGLRKDVRIDEGLEQARAGIQDHLTETAVALALPLAAQYIEWLERHPETPIAEREDRLREMENALLSETNSKTEALRPSDRDLLRQKFFSVFEKCLNLWGLPS